MKKLKEFLLNYLLRKKPDLLITFGTMSWRIESRPKYINGVKKSNLFLYADNNLVFNGSYGELIGKLKK